MNFRFFRRLSIQKKLIVILMLTSMFTLMLAFVAFIIKDMILLHQTMAHHLTSLTQVIGLNCVGALVFNDDRTAEINLSALQAMPYVSSACIYKPDGTIFAFYYRNHTDWNIPPDNFKKALDKFNKNSDDNKVVKSSDNSGYYFEGDYLFLFHKIIYDEEFLGTIFIQYNKNELIVGMKQAIFLFSLVLLVGFFAAIMISNGLQRIISEPIMHLSQTAKRISKQKDYTIRAVKCDFYQDEIGDLIKGFNEMLTEIQTRDFELDQHRQNELQQQHKVLHQ